MIDQELLKGKMADVSEQYRKLESILMETTDAILRDDLKLHTVERLFQLIVDTTVDINTHIIAENSFAAPDDYQSTFTILAEHQVIPMDFAMRIAPSVGLRNLIVHRYGKVDLRKMIDDIRANIGQYREHLALMSAYLQSPTPSN